MLSCVQLIFATVCINFAVVSCKNSLNKNCGPGNDLKEVVIKFISFTGKVQPAMKWTDNIVEGKDSAIWLGYLDTDSQFATVGKVSQDEKSIQFDPIETSVGFVCQTDGALGISIGGRYNRQAVLNFHKLWKSPQNKYTQINLQAKHGRLRLQVAYVFFDIVYVLNFAHLIVCTRTVENTYVLCFEFLTRN